MENLTDLISGDYHQMSIKTKLEEVDEYSNSEAQPVLSEKQYEWKKDQYFGNIYEPQIELTGDDNNRNRMSVKIKNELEEVGGYCDPEEEYILSENYVYEKEDEDFAEKCKFEMDDLQNKEIKTRIEADNTSESEINEDLRTRDADCDKLQFECDQCFYTTKRKPDLTRHKLVHSEERSFKCTECPVRTKTAYQLKKHQKVHTNEKQFKCDKCTFSTHIKRSFQNHLLIHQDVKPFQCNECSFQSRRVDSLVSHQIIHTDLRPFECDKCSYKAKKKRYLERHQLLHKDIDEVKLFRCTKCNYFTKFSSIISRHQLIHLDPSQVKTYQCYTCGYTTKYKAHLIRHMAKKHNN